MALNFEKYVIVYADDAYSMYNRDTAVHMRDRLSAECGFAPEIRSDVEPAAEHEFLIGRTGRPESVALYAGADCPQRMHYTVCRVGGKLLAAGNDWFSDKMAVDALCDAIAAGDAEKAFGKNIRLLGDFPARRGTLRALSYNILVEYVNWGCGGLLEGPVHKRAEAITGIIEGISPDLICLCEVFERWAATLPEYLGKRYNFLRLDREENSCNRTVLLYDKRVFREIKSGYDDIPVFRSVNNRILAWGLLERRSDGKRLLVFGTHWECTTDEDRVKQGTHMAELMREKIEKYGCESICAGDFNCVSPNMAYKNFVEKSGLRDAEEGHVPEWSVDHIFVSDKIQVAQCERIMENCTQYASDHKPLFCDFEL